MRTRYSRQYHISKFYSSPTCQSASSCASSFATMGRSAGRRHNAIFSHLHLGHRYRTCDITFEHFHSSHLSFLLLTKVYIFSIPWPFNCSSSIGYYRIHGRRTPRCNFAPRRPHRYNPFQLLALYGSGTCTTCYHAANIATDVFLETRRWNVMTTRVRCIRSRARAQMQGDVGPPLFAISLISGWEFDLLDILIRQRLCEALYALGRTMELLWTKKSTSGFLTLPNNVSRASKTLVSQLRTHSSMTPVPLLRERAKATLFVVQRFTTY
ncbi:hypothetical protein EV363DRAFT_1317540, partial [Boletus edulis]